MAVRYRKIKTGAAVTNQTRSLSALPFSDYPHLQCLLPGLLQVLLLAILSPCHARSAFMNLPTLSLSHPLFLMHARCMPGRLTGRLIPCGGAE